MHTQGEGLNSAERHGIINHSKGKVGVGVMLGKYCPKTERRTPPYHCSLGVGGEEREGGVGGGGGGGREIGRGAGLGWGGGGGLVKHIFVGHLFK